jgi:hypothetical protein
MSMSKDGILGLSPLGLFKLVFGFQPGQKLSDFATECSSLREDAAFVKETRDYALTTCASE